MALAESVTCGMAADKLSSCKGISEVLKGSLVCYTPEVKHDLLGVPWKLINACSCESMEVTRAMLKGLSKKLPADIMAAVTGLASEGGSETKHKPVGTVFFCVKYGKRELKERKVFKGTPAEIRKKACRNLYRLILSILKK